MSLLLIAVLFLLIFGGGFGFYRGYGGYNGYGGGGIGIGGVLLLVFLYLVFFRGGHL